MCYIKYNFLSMNHAVMRVSKYYDLIITLWNVFNLSRYCIIHVNQLQDFAYYTRAITLLLFLYNITSYQIIKFTLVNSYEHEIRLRRL